MLAEIVMLTANEESPRSEKNVDRTVSTVRASTHASMSCFMVSGEVPRHVVGARRSVGGSARRLARPPTLFELIDCLW
jgi:hypothetical protein